MPSSSLRNAVKRITHKERGQLQSRKKLGELQKKDDYKIRAIDHHRKENNIRSLQRKASMKNPDEFYFGMHNSIIVDGQHQKSIKAKNKEFEENVGHDTIRIMKDQDLSYIRNQRQKDLKKIEKLKASLHCLDNNNNDDYDEERNDDDDDDGVASQQRRKGKHTIFVDNLEQAKTFNVAKHFNTTDELVGRTYNRPRIDTLKKMMKGDICYSHGRNSATGDNSNDDVDGDVEENNQHQHVPSPPKPTKDELRRRWFEMKNQGRKLARARSTAYKELQARMQRVQAMTKAEAHLVTQKLLAAKGGRKRKVKAAMNGLPAQYIWRKKRLR